jgi:glycosyltransferase involved in cell wall biosynthesis
VLTKALEGLFFQKRLPDEVIVADDGSGRETEDVIRHFRGKSPFPFHHVWQEDMGFRLSKIRNEAVKKASFDYLIFLDGDCVADRHFVSDHLRLAEPGFFFQGKRMLLGKEASEGFNFSIANSSSTLFGLALRGSISNRHHLLRLPFIPPLSDTKLKGTKTCNIGILREDIVAVNGFNESFVGWGREDTEIVARLYRYGLRRKKHPFMAICFHLWHPENSRAYLKTNDEILMETLSKSDYFCENGIIKKS